MFKALEQCLADAGWEATIEAGKYGMEIVTKDDQLCIEIDEHNGTVTWDDFTHSTVLGNVFRPETLTESLKELLPLRDEPLQEWIGHRQVNQRYILKFANGDARECMLHGIEYIHVLNSDWCMKMNDTRITEVKKFTFQPTT